MVEGWSSLHCREAHHTSETWDNYRKNPRKAAHLSIVLILLEYRLANADTIKKDAQAKEFDRLCSTILQRARKQRFERNVGHDLSLRSEDIDLRSGAYVLFRQESRFRRPCQELALLAPAEGAEKARYALIIGHNLIIRGQWHVAGASIYVAGVGYREKHTPDFISLAFLEADQIAGGVLSGLSTSRREPVTMSVILMKLENTPLQVFQTLDCSDVELLAKFRDCGIPRLISAKQRKILEEIHADAFGRTELKQESWFQQKIMTSDDQFVTGFRSRENVHRVIDKGFRKFLNELSRP